MPATLHARSLTVLPLLLVTLLMASLFVVTQPAEARMSRHEKAYLGLDIVRKQKGDRYQYGAAGPNAFDCSGLVYYSFRRAGFKHVPRTSDAQARYAKRIKRRNMRKGDLIFVHRRGDVYHVGVYAGRNRHGKPAVIHAPYGSKRVNRQPIWTNSWFPGTLRAR